ncbi:MAG: hypothetical protein R3C26_02610 [Calditrichia bacterium]
MERITNKGSKVTESTNGKPKPDASTLLSSTEVIDTLTYFIDYARTMNTGSKAKSAIIDIAKTLLHEFIDELPQREPQQWMLATIKNTDVAEPKSGQTPIGRHRFRAGRHRSEKAFCLRRFSRWRMIAAGENSCCIVCERAAAHFHRGDGQSGFR